MYTLDLGRHFHLPFDFSTSPSTASHRRLQRVPHAPQDLDHLRRLPGLCEWRVVHVHEFQLGARRLWPRARVFRGRWGARWNRCQEPRRK